MSAMSAEIARAREVLAEATRGDWHAGDGLGLVSEDFIYIDGWGSIAECGEEADARAIVLAMRAIPALLDLAEAADARDGCGELCATMTPYRGCTCGHVEMRAALDRALAALQEAL